MATRSAVPRSGVLGAAGRRRRRSCAWLSWCSWRSVRRRRRCVRRSWRRFWRRSVGVQVAEYPAGRGGARSGAGAESGRRGGVAAVAEFGAAGRSIRTAGRSERRGGGYSGRGRHRGGHRLGRPHSHFRGGGFICKSVAAVSSAVRRSCWWAAVSLVNMAVVGSWCWASSSSAAASWRRSSARIRSSLGVGIGNIRGVHEFVGHGGDVFGDRF